MRALKEFASRIAFLRLLPVEIAGRLDTSEFYLPYGKVERTRRLLEKQLDSYVMSYRVEVFNRNAAIQSHLCANLEGAQLNSAGLGLLQSKERELRRHGVRFVAYAKPLKLIRPEQSPVAALIGR